MILGARGMLGQAMAATWADHYPLLFDRVELDITDDRAVIESFELHRPSLVINCAGYTAVDKCETNEAAALAINGQAVGILARAAAGSNARFIHFSTDYVFDGHRPAGYTEGSPVNPLNTYGRTKAAGEHEWLESGCDGFLIRTSWLYGPGGRNFVDVILNAGRRSPEVRVVDDQHGIPTNTVDLARFTRQLIEDGYESGIYHGVSHGRTTWYKLACEAFRTTGMTSRVIPCTTAEFQRPAPRPKWSVLLNTKGPSLRPWRDALHEYLRTSVR